MDKEGKELEKTKYSGLKIAVFVMSKNDVLCFSVEKENGTEWGNGNDGWDIFD